MLWLAAYLTGFPPVGLHALCWTHGLAPMWSDLYLISTMEQIEHPLLYFVSVNALSGLYLISTPIKLDWITRSSFVCQCLSGLYLISTVPLQKPRFYAVFRACFYRYLSEYSDNSCFSCMLTFWTYLTEVYLPFDTGLSIALITTVVILFFTLLIS